MFIFYKEVNRDMERLIGGRDRGGSMSFHEFVKLLNLYHEGDVRYSFMEEKLEQKTNPSIFDQTEEVSRECLL